ncbi:MAG: class I SAM-dependent methyltransferase [Planctomycetota bacterium]
MTTATLDQKRADAFTDRLLATLNGGALALMTSIGHRTGLFDALGDGEPVTSDELAGKAGLDERYVREWLGAMLTGRIVEHDPATQRFSLPAEHAAALTRAAAPNNVAALAQYIGLLGTVEDRIVECFENGGGVPYAEYGRFQEVMAEDSGQTVLPVLTEAILPLVPGLPEELEAGVDVLDIGCGEARALNLMARQYPKSRFVGYDLSQEGIDAGRAEARAQGSRNVRLDVSDVTDLQEVASFDLITAFDAIHDQAHPDRVLLAVYRALRPDGVFLMQDISASSDVAKNADHPLGTLLYTISCMHCMTVSLACNGHGLGAMWGREKAREMLVEAGFKRIRIHDLPHDPQNCYYVVRK